MRGRLTLPLNSNGLSLRCRVSVLFVELYFGNNHVDFVKERGSEGALKRRIATAGQWT